MSKKLRQEALIELIREQIVDTQEDLQRLLKSKGFDVTQATVSRDIKDLRIVKAMDRNGIYRYCIQEAQPKSSMQEKYIEVFVNSVVGIDYAMNDVVIHCHAGMASGACAAIDGLFRDYVLGTLAGDDTIFAITHSEKQAVELVNKLKELAKL